MAIEIIGYEARFSAEIVKMVRDSKEAALGVPEKHSFESHLKFLTENLAKRAQLFLAQESETGQIVGLMALEGESVEQLYLHVDYQRQGLGTRFLELARQHSPHKLHLYTFDVNKGAQAFYEKHGFQIIGRGIAADEGLADIEYEWREKGNP